MAQHTPGPWQAEYGTDGYYYVSQDGGIELQEVNGGVNARLIAAAPDLLEALRLCAPFAANAAWDDNTAEHAVKMADAAIAKAIGKDA